MTEHEPGRDLDKLIAEKIMGWRPSIANGYIDDRDAFRLPEEVPHYSTEIAAAWLVVEHLRARGWRYEVSAHVRNETTCALFGRGEYDVYDCAYEESHQMCGIDAPHAIGLASLLTVEETNQ